MNGVSFNHSSIGILNEKCHRMISRGLGQSMDNLGQMIAEASECTGVKARLKCEDGTGGDGDGERLESCFK